MQYLTHQYDLGWWTKAAFPLGCRRGVKMLEKGTWALTPEHTLSFPVRFGFPGFDLVYQRKPS